MSKFTFLRLLLVFAALPFFANATEFFFPWQYSTTSTSHSISLGNSLLETPTINGVPIEAGDWIGVFYEDPCGLHCGGSVEWITTGGVGVQAFGDDNLTPFVKDGFAIVEVFKWKIYDASSGLTYDAVATYQLPGQDIFIPSGLSFVTTLVATGDPTAERNVSGRVVDNNGVALENVTITFDNSGGSTMTDVNGYYCLSMPYTWNGNATPSLSGYSFDPTDRTYADILNSPRNQNYVGTFTGTFYSVSGTITDGTNPIENVEVTFTGVGSVFTDVNGDYVQSVPEGYTGSATPALACYTFSPASLAYTNVTADQIDQDYTGTIDGPYSISGTITDGTDPIVNVEVAFDGIGSVFTDVAGAYTQNVPCGWSGTATPSLTGYNFNPPTKTYSNVTANLTGEDYSGSMQGPYDISGTITDGSNPLENVEVVFDGLGSAFTDASGFYTYAVPYGWDGNATPALQCYAFTPEFIAYTDVIADMPNQDYTAIVSGNASISGVILDGGVPVVGIEVVFDGVGTAITNGLGEYTQDVPCGWTGVATPTSQCYSFAPASRSYEDVMGDMTGEDYNATLFGPYTISGTITDGTDPIANLAVDFEGLGSVLTDVNGDYSQTVPCGWSGNVAPISDCYEFTPDFISFNDVLTDFTDQDFTGTLQGPYTLSGYITSIATGLAMENVEVVFDGIGSVFTDANGYYSQIVPCGWTGNVTPYLLTWAFNPPSRSYTYVTSDLDFQDFSGTQDMFILSGTITDGVNPLAGVQVIFNNNGGTAITDANGYYEHEIFSGYTGTATPLLTGYAFTPPSRIYANISGDLTAQDYQGYDSNLPPDWNYTITGTSHIISIPLASNPNIDGIPLTPGDYIGVFFDDGGTMVCGGAVMWNGATTVALLAYGDDQTTGDKDGFTVGENFSWKVYSWTAGESYDAVATYDMNLPQNDGTFFPDGLSALLSLDATGNTYTVSGTITLDGVGLEGVTVAFDNAGGFATTDATGFYSKTLLKNWTGTAFPAKIGHNFTPVNRFYAPLASDFTDQDYTAALNIYVISGMITDSESGDPIHNVILFFDNGGGSTQTLSNGYYSIGVEYGYTGTAYPSKDNYSFEPIERNYLSVSADLPDEDYLGTEIVLPPGWEFEVTSTSHVISVPLESMPNINDVPLQAGDFIGVFYDDEGVMKCGGAIQWNAVNPVAVIAYGDDNTTTDKDGFAIGEDFTWKVYSSYVGETYDATVTYDPDQPNSDGKFYVDGISALLSLDAVSNTMFAISGYVLDSESGLGVEGVTVTFSNGAGEATTDATGFYTHDVLFGYSGIATPAKVRYQFLPETVTYFQVMEPHTDDYTAIFELIPPGWEVIPTGTSHSISVPVDVNPRIDGVPLVPGDFIGVFFYDPATGTEICGGYAEWDGTIPVAVIAYGDDMTTTEKDGFGIAENFRWKVFSWDLYEQHEAIAVYDETMPNFDGKFYPDGLSALIDLYADPLMVVASADPEIICYDGSTQLNAVATGGSGFYTYSWTPADNLDDPTIANPIASNLTASTVFTIEVNTFENTATDNVEVTVYNDLMATIAEDQIICYNTIPAELTSSVSGGQGNYTYQWWTYVDEVLTVIEGATDPTYQPPALTETSTYVLQVIDFCGEVITDPVVITVYDEFMASIAADQTICYNTAPEVLTSTVTGGEGVYAYQWWTYVDEVLTVIEGATDPTYQPPALIEDSQYVLQVTDPCGEVITDPVTITVYDDLMASIAADQVICEGTAPDELTSTVSGGAGNYSYQWQIDTTGVFEDIEGATSATYQPGNLYGVTLYRLVFTDDCGTVITDPVTITFYDALAVSIAAEQTICYNTQPDALTSNASGGQGNYTYQWQYFFEDDWMDIEGATDATYQPPVLTDDMIYRLELTDFCGVEYSDELAITVIQLPTANAGDDDETCENVALQLNGSAENYSSVMWTTDGDGTFDDPTSLTAMYTAGPEDAAFGSANLTLTAYAIEPCTESATDDVTVFFALLPEVEAGDDATICEDDFHITLGWTTNAWTILWTTDGDGTFDDPTSTAALYFPGPNDIATGSVELTLTANPIPPCTQSVSDAMMLYIQYLPEADAGEDAAICETDTYMLMGSAENASSVEWTTSGDGTFDDATMLDATYTPGANDIANGMATLTLTAFATGPCDTDASDDMVLNLSALPMASAGPDASVCGADPYEILGSSASNYSELEWLTSGTGTFDDPSALHPIYTPSAGDIADGSVTLSFTAFAIAPCFGEDMDEMTLSFTMPPTADAGPDDAICQGEVYVLDGDASDYASIEWTTDGDGTFDDPTSLNATYTPGTLDIFGGTVDLTLTAYASAPCPDDAVDMMTLTISKSPTAEAGEDAKICEDESYTLSGSADNYSSVKWTTSGDGTFDDNTILDATYLPGPNDVILGYADLTLTAYPIEPCSFQASDVMTLSIDKLPEQPGIPEGPVEACANDVYVDEYTTSGSVNALSYYWEIFPENAAVLEGEGTTVTVNWTGEYYGPVFLKVQGVNDCGAGEFSENLEITALNCVGLPEDPNASLNINVYPNPTDGLFNLEISGMNDDMDLYIVDYKGQLIHQDVINSGESLKKLDISTYPKGIYFLKLVNGSTVKVEKIVLR